jgi:hypothetical protein
MKRRRKKTGPKPKLRALVRPGDPPWEESDDWFEDHDDNLGSADDKSDAGK